MSNLSVSPMCLKTKIRGLEQYSVNVQVHCFLDIEAIVGIEDEEELDDQEEVLGKSCVFLIHSNLICSVGELLDDDELVLDDEMEIALQACFPNREAQDLEDEAVRVVARAGHTRPLYTKTDDIPLPFWVPRSTDPSIWSIRVKVGMLLHP